jgi:porphobilinogen synthase
MPLDLPHRPRRLRQNVLLRDAVAETRVHRDQLIYPCFVRKGEGVKDPIASMPGIHHFSVDELLRDAELGLSAGINKVLLFGVHEPKSAGGDAAWNELGVVPQAVKALKQAFDDALYVITDVCLCAYTDHGHCGVVEGRSVQNDPSVENLVRMALAHAQAGVDMIAPSDMMDGRIGAMRAALDAHGFDQTPIMSYAAKFASAYYGPFRDAAASAPGFGDRRSYQMDVRNGREAVREALLDEAQGADVLMVKPALAYLDVIAGLHANTRLPVACYNVSAEYSMVKLAAQAGLVDERLMVLENLHAFARAGADLIITYHARQAAELSWL